MRFKLWMKVTLGVVALLLIAEVLLFETAAAPGAKYVIDLDALHRAAIASGPLPDHLEVERVGEFAFPGAIVVAGDSFRTRPMTLLAHRVVWADHSLVIDTAMSPAAAKVMPGSKPDTAAFERVEQAMKQADAII